MSINTLLGHLNDLLAHHANKRTNGRQASHATATGTGQVLRTAFRDLWRLGYRLSDPKNLGTRHVKALVQHWYKKPIAVSTIQERLSRLRVLCGWLGKTGMIQSLPRRCAGRETAWTYGAIGGADCWRWKSATYSTIPGRPAMLTNSGKLSKLGASRSKSSNTTLCPLSTSRAATLANARERPTPPL